MHGTKKSGFTLIELSIVLVIIGLLIGTIVTAKYLIQSAKIRGQAVQLTAYAAAVNAFHTKYGSLPGDMLSNKALQFGLPASAGTNMSNGDGIYNGVSTPNQTLNPYSQEFVNFWPQLSYAGLVEGNYSCPDFNTCFGLPNSVYTGVSLSYPDTVGNYFPAMKINPTLGILPVTIGKWGGDFWMLGVIDYNPNVCVTCSPPAGQQPSLTPMQPFQLDLKIDAGIPSSGLVRAMMYTNGLSPAGEYYTEYSIDNDNNNLGSNCVITGQPAYNLTGNLITCTMVVGMQ